MLSPRGKYGVTHKKYMLQALSLAQLRRGFCAPNPAVGALVVKDGKVLGEGFHKAPGQAHAEVNALAGLSDEQTQGATVYVTLEPCCHQGRTPPCVDLLIKKRIHTVYYGFKDPNPIVAGQGAKQLRAAGINCQCLPLAALRDFYQSYAYWSQHRLPWVTAKIALSLDGKTAGIRGEPVAITGSEVQQFTHQCRKKSDAILTTVKTIRCDNPQLNVRLGIETLPKPLYVIDSKLTFPLDAQVLKTAARITVFYQEENTDSAARNQLLARNIRCVPIEGKHDKLSLKTVIEYIGQDGVHDLWVEAGGTCFQALLTENLVQRAFIYQSLKWLGESAQSAFTDDVNEQLQKARQVLRYTVGNDVICDLSFKSDLA